MLTLELTACSPAHVENTEERCPLASHSPQARRSSMHCWPKHSAALARTHRYRHRLPSALTCYACDECLCLALSLWPRLLAQGCVELVQGG